MIDISKDIRSLSEFKRNRADFMNQIRTSGHPLVLTVNGNLEALEGTKKGLSDVEADRVTPLQQFEAEFRKTRGLPSRSR